MHILRYAAIQLLAPTIFLFFSTPSLGASPQENFEILLNAVYQNDFDLFEETLMEGADPNFIGEVDSPTSWINCAVARTKNLDWLKTLQAHGGDLDFIRDEYASERVAAPYSSAHMCSIMNQDIDVFIYLTNHHSKASNIVCHLCEDQQDAISLLLQCLIMNKFDRAYWLLKNIESTSTNITDEVLDLINRSGKSTRKDRLNWYWKTVDYLEDLGYELNPNITR